MLLTSLVPFFHCEQIAGETEIKVSPSFLWNNVCAWPEPINLTFNRWQRLNSSSALFNIQLSTIGVPTGIG